MEQNVGANDKLLRILAGAGLGTAALGILAGILPGAVILSPILGIAALVLLYTALTGFCGVYAVLGLDTCSVDSPR